MAGGPHPQNPSPNTSNPAADAPCSQATAVKLVAKVGLTEAEAQAILAAREVTNEELHDAQKVDVHAIASAFTAAATDALKGDEKLELSADDKADTVDRAARVRTLSSGCDKLQFVHDAALASGRMDASVLQVRMNGIVPQLKTRAKVNPAVETTYSSFLSYQHSRYPGRKKHPAAPKGANGGQTDPGAK